MKKILLLCLIPSFSFAQCKYDVDNFDPFLKVHKTEESVKISNGIDGFVQLKFCKYNSPVFFRLEAVSENPMVVGKYDAFMFLLNDDSVVRAYPDQVYAADISTLNDETTLNATYYFDNPDALQKLKESSIKAVRIYYNSVYHEYPIKPKFSKALLSTVQCFNN